MYITKNTVVQICKYVFTWVYVCLYHLNSICPHAVREYGLTLIIYSSFVTGYSSIYQYLPTCSSRPCVTMQVSLHVQMSPLTCTCNVTWARAAVIVTRSTGCWFLVDRPVQASQNAFQVSASVYIHFSLKIH